MLAAAMILPPFLAALTIGLGLLFGHIAGENSERLTGRICLSAATLTVLAVVTAATLHLAGKLDDQLVLGTWLRSGAYHIDLSFTFDSLGLLLASLVALFSLMATKFSVNYMHREDGFHRFFMVLSLFSGAMLLLVTASNAALTFVGWELAGICSYLLIAYAFDRATAAGNATRALVTNRIGDAGFVLGIFLCFAWIGSIEWHTIIAEAIHLAEWKAGVLACCFLLAAMAKSAQVPLSPWLARAMEGPTPSSAIFYGALMVHAGVYLVLRLQPLFEHAPWAMALMLAMGLLTAVYGFFCGLTQTDVKSALIFSTSGQVGLMFAEAGCGWWRFALWHLCAHALLRGFQFLTAPSLMHQILGSPTRPVPGWLAGRRWLYLASLQRFWLEHLGDWLLVKPIHRLSTDLSRFDARIIQAASGRSLPPLSSMPREQITEGSVDIQVIRVDGLAGRLVYRLAEWLHWIESRLILEGVGKQMLTTGRRLGTHLNRFEAMLNEPRFLVVFVLATLLTVF